MTEHSPFLRLPIEIRLQIYSHLYEPPEGQYPIEASFPIWGPAPIWLHRLELYRGDLYPACNSTKRAFWSILQVCKMVNQEVLDLLFERLLFTMFVPDSMAGDTLSAGPVKLGLAKDFTFWHRARRLLLVSIDDKHDSIKSLICTLGFGLRNFKSTPHDTRAYLYLQEEFELAACHEQHPDHKAHKDLRKQWQRSLKSFSSLSQRACIDLEVKMRPDIDDLRDRALQLAAAANASLTLVSVTRRPSLLPRFGEEEHIESSERLDRRHEMVDDCGNKAKQQRVVCYMSIKARFYAGRNMALKRRKDSMLRIKKMYEGRLG